MTNHRPLFEVKLDSLIRRFLLFSPLSHLPVYLVNEYPKSGGTWLAQMVSDYLGLPFYRNRLPRLVPQILHGHYRYHPFLKNVVNVIRDGRDVMVSYYYHCLFIQENGNNWPEVQQSRKALMIADPDDIYHNLPTFIEYTFEKKQHPRFSWVEFCGDWIDKLLPIIRYEDMLNDTSNELKSTLINFGTSKIDSNRLENTIGKYQFERQSGRPSGTENITSFLRKGIAGDWRNKFSSKACEVFNEYGGSMLIRLGYESDDNWVKQRNP